MFRRLLRSSGTLFCVSPRPWEVLPVVRWPLASLERIQRKCSGYFAVWTRGLRRPAGYTFVRLALVLQQFPLAGSATAVRAAFTPVVSSETDFWFRPRTITVKIGSLHKLRVPEGSLAQTQPGSAIVPGALSAETSRDSGTASSSTVFSWPRSHTLRGIHGEYGSRPPVSEIQGFKDFSHRIDDVLPKERSHTLPQHLLAA